MKNMEKCCSNEAFFDCSIIVFAQIGERIVMEDSGAFALLQAVRLWRSWRQPAVYWLQSQAST